MEMLTIKSDDVYGRAKAYESIIKGTEIQGPKVPESFNVLVKELQGLGLKVDLFTQNTVIDAEQVLAENIKEEAALPAEVEAPVDLSDALPNITEESVANEFVVIGEDDDLTADSAVTMSDDDNVALVTSDDENEEKL